MTIADYSKDGMAKVQMAQNILTPYYALFMFVMRKMVTELPLYFDFWEPYEYDTDASGDELWSIPIWDTEYYSAFSHLPLISSDHHFTTLKPEERSGKNKKKTSDVGDAYLTLRIAPNRAVQTANFGGPPEEWPAELPIEGPYAEAVVYRVTAPGSKPLTKLWGGADYPEDSSPDGKTFGTGAPNLQGWTKTFDLGEFLADPAPLMEEIRAVLSGQK
jgi:hypothetical protein